MTTQEGGSMKKYIVVSIVMVLMLVMGGSFVLAQPQDSATEEKPTFYRLIPGVYVNGWPRFTVTYPKDWVEYRPQVQVIFLVGAPDFSERLAIDIGNPYPLDKSADILVIFFKNIGAKDVTVMSDKPSQLRDGTPAREVEMKMVFKDVPMNFFYLSTKKGDMPRVSMNLISSKVIGEDQKTIPYSLKYETGKDEPVKVPPDIQEFLDRYRNDVLSHDLTKVMTHYSDRYLSSGTRKGETERFLRQIIDPITSFEVGITDFVAEGDKAYLTGFSSSYWGKAPFGGAIIKENGEWKFFGNQRDVVP
jgi:hypothetical protein